MEFRSISLLLCSVCYSQWEDHFRTLDLPGLSISTLLLFCEDSLRQKCTETNRNIINIKRYLVSTIPQEKLLAAMNGVLPDLTAVLLKDEQNTKQF
ncbi:hypothetical protein AVEN_263569-1 [Araneus ventricosus]|uniref:Uncharacterized protein n=1 Tax=Araneus ventricosus TaxID=182803 RepID=A0A4Y2HU88_ARAVE|nr:hypothetical protein AVEN_263569-1 [Araneus ventricosus]